MDAIRNTDGDVVRQSSYAEIVDAVFTDLAALAAFDKLAASEAIEHKASSERQRWMRRQADIGLGWHVIRAVQMQPGMFSEADLHLHHGPRTVKGRIVAERIADCEHFKCGLSCDEADKVAAWFAGLHRATSPNAKRKRIRSLRFTPKLRDLVFRAATAKAPA